MAAAAPVDVQQAPQELRLEERYEAWAARPGTPMDDELKAALIREVTEAVREQVDTKTSATIDTVWQKGQRAMQALQKQQLVETKKLQQQLDSCTETHRHIEQENMMLHQGLEALMKHLTVAFGVPPAMQQPAGAPQGSASGSAAATQAVASGVARGEGGHTDSGLERITEQEAAAARGVASASSSGSASAASTGTDALSAHASVSSTASTFTVALRRADNTPLGLDISSDTSGLLVMAVRPGGAVDAWNRQCAGDAREIRAGDRIIKCNDAEDPEAMHAECVSKHLVRMTLQRGPASAGMRADAYEFVPQAAGSP